VVRQGATSGAGSDVLFVTDTGISKEGSGGHIRLTPVAAAFRAASSPERPLGLKEDGVAQNSKN